MIVCTFRYYGAPHRFGRIERNNNKVTCITARYYETFQRTSIIRAYARSSCKGLHRWLPKWLAGCLAVGPPSTALKSKQKNMSILNNMQERERERERQWYERLLCGKSINEVINMCNMFMLACCCCCCCCYVVLLFFFWHKLAEFRLSYDVKVTSHAHDTVGKLHQLCTHFYGHTYIRTYSVVCLYIHMYVYLFA